MGVTRTGAYPRPMATAVLYDDACNLCKVLVDGFLSWDRRGALRPVAIQSPEGQALLHAVPEALRLASFHLVDDAGTVLSGGPALARLLGLVPGGRPVGTLLGALPGPTARAYEWVARNRITLSKAVPTALKRRATRRLAAAKG